MHAVSDLSHLSDVWGGTGKRDSRQRRAHPADDVGRNRPFVQTILSGWNGFLVRTDQRIVAIKLGAAANAILIEAGGWAVGLISFHFASA